MARNTASCNGPARRTCHQMKELGWILQPERYVASPINILKLCLWVKGLWFIFITGVGRGAMGKARECYRFI